MAQMARVHGQLVPWEDSANPDPEEAEADEAAADGEEGEVRG